MSRGRLLGPVLWLAWLESLLACGPGGGSDVSNLNLARLFYDSTRASTYTSRAAGVADSPSDLSCSFDSPSELCAWDNYGLDDDYDWRRGQAEAREARLKDEPIECRTYRGLAQTYCFPEINPALPPEQRRLCLLYRDNCQRTSKQRRKRQAGRSLPEGAFLFAGREGGGPTSDTAIIGARIPCQAGTARLSFDQWQTNPGGSLRVCVRPERAPATQRCLATFTRGSPTRAQVDIDPPEGRLPFFIELEASGNDQGAAIVDNIDYDGTFCAGGGGGGGGRPPRPPPRPQNGGQAREGCGNLECDFNRGTTCAWDTRGRGSRDGQWKHGGGKVGNPSTGIRLPNPQDGNDGYAYVGQNAGTQPGAVYVLESPSFELDSIATLTFDVFRQSARPSLQVCMDDIDECPYELRRLEARDRQQPWILNQEVSIPASARRVAFVVRNLGDNDFIAVDRVRLDSAGRCTVFLPALSARRL